MIDQGVEVFLDAPARTIARRSTDWAMKLKLRDAFRNNGFRLPGGVVYDLLDAVRVVFRRFFGRKLGETIEFRFSKLRALVLRMKGAQVLVAQGGFPPLPKRCKVIWETYFLPPQRGDRFRSGTFERGGTDPWVRRMEQYGPLVARIAVRGSASVELVKEMYPEFATKVVDLPFVQPEYDIVSEDFVRQKQGTGGLVEIVFVGREAKRKGLDNLVAALALLRRRGIQNFKLTAVSMMMDGVIDLPKVEWIEFKREISHDEAMALFRRAQIFAMPSRFESYGLVYLEAMASGCLTVVRDEDPQREFVDDGNAGVCVDPFSVEDIANGLEQVIVDVGLRTKLAIRGLHRYETEFSQKVIRKKWIDVIEAVKRDVSGEMRK